MIRNQQPQSVDEWSLLHRWNPFNSYKLLSQVYRWQLIQQGHAIPQPVLVTVDPMNMCNFHCPWCNSARVKERGHGISRAALIKLADFLASWKGSDGWPGGVEAVCIAGGGEPLLNRHIGGFIDRCRELGIEVGVVTNGYHIDRFIEPLSRCTWVGVSVDAHTPRTYNFLKGLPPRSRALRRVFRNMEALIKHAAARKSLLAADSPGSGVSYKYLLSTHNVREVYDAALKARELGCKNFHLRPMGNTWFNLQLQEEYLSVDLPHLLAEQVDLARRLEARDFGVYAVTHKFGDQFQSNHQFSSCHAIFMTAVFMPPSDPRARDSVDVGLCCDRRGDRRLLLASNISRMRDVAESWGGERHWNMHKKIKLRQCPRCTYQPHNQIFEQVILNDSMTYRFI